MKKWDDEEEILKRLTYFYQKQGRLPQKQDLDWALNDYWPNSRQIALVFGSFEEGLARAWKKIMKTKLTVIK